MENRNLFFGIIGLLILVVVGLAVDRSNQFTTLTSQAETVATQAQEASDNFSATIEAQSAVIDEQILNADTLSTQVAVSSTDFEAQISELSDAASALESVNTDFATQVADLSGQRDELTNQSDSQATEVASLMEDLDDASGQNEGLGTQVADLSDENNALATQVADLDGRNDRLSTQVFLRYGENALLSEDNEALSTQVANLQTDLDEAGTNADGLQTQVADSVDEVATLSAENQVLQTQVAELMPTATPTPQPTMTPDLSVPDMADLEFVFQLDIENRGFAQVSPDGESIAILREDNMIELVDTLTGDSLNELTDFDGEISDIIFASDSSIAGVLDSTKVILLDSESGNISFEHESNNPITDYDLSEDGNAIIIGDTRSIEIIVFDPGRNQTRQGGVTALDWSADGSQIVTSSGTTLTLFEISNYLISGSSEIDTSSAQVVDVVFSPDGSHIAGATVSSDLIVWSVESGEVVWQTEIDADSIDDMVWSSDSEYLVVVADGDIRVYSTTGSWVAHANIDGVTSVDWSSNGEFLVFASTDQVSVVGASALLN